jgi:ubiquinol-cytochrome c reductase cytochrome c1 subunit
MKDMRMIDVLKPAALRAAGLALALTVAGPALAAGDSLTPPRQKWSFAGMFGRYDNNQLQRGFQVYQNVCAACHSMTGLSFRNLAEKGGPEFKPEQIRELASKWPIQVKDGPNDRGEMFERPARLGDRIPSPFANIEAGKAANGGAYPPDFSVLAKARTYRVGFPGFVFDALPGFTYQEGGVDYIYALLALGYKDPPAGVTVEPGLHYNAYMPGGKIAMPMPLADGAVEYTDGTPATVDQYARDVTAFMMWAAEPHLEARKRMGFNVLVFLAVFAGLLYYTKKKVWAGVKGTPGVVPH